MHDNPDVPQAIRLPQEHPSAPKCDTADGKENERTVNVFGPIRQEHLAQAS
jgi:hypothetical protein